MRQTIKLTASQLELLRLKNEGVLAAQRDYNQYLGVIAEEAGIPPGVQLVASQHPEAAKHWSFDGKSFIGPEEEKQEKKEPALVIPGKKKP